MKFSISIFILLTSLCLYSQEILTQEKIRKEVESSASILSIELVEVDSEFSILLIQDLIIENVNATPCLDIDTDSIKNTLVLKILEEESLLENFYLMIDKELVSLISGDHVAPDNSILNIYLLNYNGTGGIVVIPILDSDRSIEFVSKLSTIYGRRKCFRKLNKHIKTKHNKG